MGGRVLLLLLGCILPKPNFATASIMNAEVTESAFNDWWSEQGDSLPQENFLVLNLDGYDSSLAHALAGRSKVTVVTLSGVEELLISQRNTCSHLNTAVYPSTEVLRELHKSPELFDVVLCLRCLLIDANSEQDVALRAGLIAAISRHALVFVPSFVHDMTSRSISLSAARFGASVVVSEPKLLPDMIHSAQYCAPTNSTMVPPRMPCCPLSPEHFGHSAGTAGHRAYLTTVRKTIREVGHHYGAKDAEWARFEAWQQLQGSGSGSKSPFVRKYRLEFTKGGATLENLATKKVVTYRGGQGVTLSTLLSLGIGSTARYSLYSAFLRLPIYGDMAPWNIVYRNGCMMDFVDQDAEKENGASILYMLTASLLLQCHGRMEFDLFSDGIFTACGHDELCGDRSLDAFLDRSYAAIKQCMAGLSDHKCEGMIACADGSCVPNARECFVRLGQEDMFSKASVGPGPRYSMLAPGSTRSHKLYECSDLCNEMCHRAPPTHGQGAPPPFEAPDYVDFAECISSCVKREDSVILQCSETCLKVPEATNFSS